ncbi:DUF1702 family protein [Planomonospora alba]|uniref:DUF1702 family protein n=1 Tax=Planomonospora alba TaxID=161354 RepID=A0ABP6MMR8_9ACTN
MLRRPLTLDVDDLDLGRRGFASASPQARPALDAAVTSFAAGYNAALVREPDALTFTHLDPGLRGFAFEGAAMSTALLDLLTGTRGRRLLALQRGDGRRYVHLIQVGAGWAFARMRLRPWTGVRSDQPLLRWLAWDGWGFHQAFFRPARVFAGRVERTVEGRFLPIRDQGAGRALWFYAGADPARIAATIRTFPASRRADLWAGIGLAAGYTGAQTVDVLDRLIGESAGYHEHLAQGAAFAAKAHHLAESVTAQVATAVRTLTGAEPEIAAGWTDDALHAVPDRQVTAQDYQQWRARIRHAWSLHTRGVTR